MNSNQGVIFCVFITIASNMIHCVLGLYEPIVYFDANDIHYFAFLRVDYDTINKHYVVKGVPKGEKIFSACPSQNPDYPNAFDVRSTEVDQSAIIPICEKPVESQIYFPKNPLNYSVVGFLIHTPDKEGNRQFLQIPEHHAVIGLIYFKFDGVSKRISSLWYPIAGGKLLKPELSRREDELWKYRKNENIYDYDIDTLYSQPGCPFVKVPLAPEEDFLFDNWKSASRQNMLTAPMWSDLQAQWQALEIFIRKVTQVIGSIEVEAGIYGDISNKLPRGKRKRDSLFKNERWKDEKYKIPMYFWKAITLQFSRNDQQFNYGILFVMHNVVKLDSDTKSYVLKICSDYDIAKLGWKFLRDDQFKSLMYGCPFSEETMSNFDEIIEEEFEDFNLNLLSVLEFDDDGNANVKQVNVVQEIEKLEATRNQDISEQ